MTKTLRLLLVFIFTLSLLGLPVRAALAECATDGDTSNDDIITCSGTDPDGLDTGGATVEDIVTVQAGATVSNNGASIQSIDDLSVYNNGTITSDSSEGISVGGDGVVVNDGQIQSSSNGVVISGNGVVTNTGEISSVDYQGVDIGEDAYVNNSGLISSFDVAVYFSNVGVNGTATLINDGEIISSDSDAVYDNGGTSLSVFNGSSGVIAGDDNGINSSSSNISIVNYGNITGGDRGVYITGDINTLNNYGNITGITNAGIEVTGYTNGPIYNNGTITSDSSEGISVGGDGVVVNDGQIQSSSNGVVISGNGVVTNTGEISSVDYQGVDIGEDAYVNNSGLISSFDVAVYFSNVGVNGTATLINDGEIISSDSDAVYDNGGTSLSVFNGSSGVIAGDDNGIDSDSDNFSIVNYGLIVGGEGTAIDGSSGVDVVFNYGTILGGDDGAINLKDGDDQVVLGTGGASYGTTCGDIGVTTVSYRAATVVGLMDGGNGNDTLTFSLLTPDQKTIDGFAALDPAGGSISDGQGGSYNWDGFETLTVNAIRYNEGATRLFDDGVMLAFAANGGIDVCSGEQGFRAGTINFAALDAGQTTFSAGNAGWFVRVNALGSGKFEAHIFDGSGIEHFNDANRDGTADSVFVFSR